MLDDQAGLASPKGRPSQPWEPTPETPEIPLTWLAGEPRVAFEMQRKTHMYTRMAIPALLHTCVESRQTLMNLGHELAFGTRSAAPRVWFPSWKGHTVSGNALRCMRAW